MNTINVLDVVRAFQRVLFGPVAPAPDPESMPDPVAWPITYAQWPKDRPLPTAEQWAEAVRRFREENEREREDRKRRGMFYGGDCGYSLGFDMATCARELWWHFFFPEEDLREGLWRRVLDQGGKP